MANYGAKVSRIGYPVESASDKQLAFSSDWPLLPIEAEGNVTLSVPASGPDMVTQTLYTHNLGYEPVFYVEKADSGFFWPAWAWCNDSEIYVSMYVSESINLKWKVFRRPLKTNYTAPIINTTDVTQQIDDDYGILVSLPNKDISSTDKRDFGIRSDVRQLMIAQSGYTTTADYGGSTTHNLGYKPTFLLYMESDSVSGDYRLATSGNDLKVDATTTTLTWLLYTPPGRNWAYIIFKDTLTTNG